MDFSVILSILIGLFQSTIINNCGLVQKMVEMGLKEVIGRDMDGMIFCFLWDDIWDLLWVYHGLSR